MKRLSLVAGILLAALIAFGGMAVSAQQANQKGSIRIKSDEAGFAEMAKISAEMDGRRIFGHSLRLYVFWSNPGAGCVFGKLGDTNKSER